MSDQQTNEDKDREPDEIIREGRASSFKQWLQDNTRIILSILIVIAIAGGIYSYSKRSETQNNEVSSVEQGTNANNTSDNSQSTVEVSPNEAATQDNSAAATAQDNSGTVAPENGQATVAPAQSSSTANITAQETEDSFIETAAKGDSATRLARRALADYLDKNADSGLKVEQKIYIEDYLQKKASPAGKKYTVGTTLEVKKQLIEEAINSAKQLSDAQINHLSRYVPLVPSLS